MDMKVFCRYVLVIVLSFSLKGSFSDGEAFWSGLHNIGEIGESSHKAHAAPAHSHQPCGHEPHQADSSKECCQTPHKHHADSTQIPTFPNRTKTSQRHLAASFSAQITTICCLQLSENRLIPTIFNTSDPTLESLRTVILLV